MFAMKRTQCFSRIDKLCLPNSLRNIATVAFQSANHSSFNIEEYIDQMVEKKKNQISFSNWSLTERVLDSFARTVSAAFHGAVIGALLGAFEARKLPNAQDKLSKIMSQTKDLGRFSLVMFGAQNALRVWRSKDKQQNTNSYIAACFAGAAFSKFPTLWGRTQTCLQFSLTGFFVNTVFLEKRKRWDLSDPWFFIPEGENRENEIREFNALREKLGVPMRTTPREDLR